MSQKRPEQIPVQRGDMVQVWDPRADGWYPLVFLVVSAERFHRNGRNEVQLCELPRPFKPMVVLRSRCRRLGRVKEEYRKAVEKGLPDFIAPGVNDDVKDNRSVPGSVVELDVSFSDGKSYAQRPAVIVSRPLLCNALDILYFMDISTGEIRDGDHQLLNPVAAELQVGSFVKPRLWWTERSEMDLYNRAWVRRRLTSDDLRESVLSLGRMIEVSFQEAWTAANEPR